MGSNGRHWQGLHPRPVVDGDVSWSGHIPGGDGLQSPWRRLTRGAVTRVAAALAKEGQLWREQSSREVESSLPAEKLMPPSSSMANALPASSTQTSKLPVRRR